MALRHIYRNLDTFNSARENIFYCNFFFFFFFWGGGGGGLRQGFDCSGTSQWVTPMQCAPQSRPEVRYPAIPLL